MRPKKTAVTKRENLNYNPIISLHLIETAVIPAKAGMTIKYNHGILRVTLLRIMRGTLCQI